MTHPLIKHTLDGRYVVAGVASVSSLEEAEALADASAPVDAIPVDALTSAGYAPPPRHRLCTPFLEGVRCTDAHGLLDSFNHDQK